FRKVTSIKKPRKIRGFCIFGDTSRPQKTPSAGVNGCQPGGSTGGLTVGFRRTLTAVPATSKPRAIQPPRAPDRAVGDAKERHRVSRQLGSLYGAKLMGSWPSRQIPGEEPRQQEGDASSLFRTLVVRRRSAVLCPASSGPAQPRPAVPAA